MIISILILAAGSLGCSIDPEKVMEVEGLAIAIPFPSENGETAIFWNEPQDYCEEFDTSSVTYTSRFIIPNAKELDIPGELWRGQMVKKIVYVKFKVKDMRDDRYPIINVLEIRVD